MSGSEEAVDATQAARIGAQVRQARKRRGWSQRDLAREAGIVANTVGRIERGEPTRSGNLRAVLDALELEAATSYSGEVEIARDLVGHWLAAMPLEERKAAAADLVRFVMERSGNAHS